MAVFIVCMFAALLLPGLVWPYVNGRLIRRRGFDPEVYPHNADRPRGPGYPDHP